MKPELRRVGRSQAPVVVIDDFTGSVDTITEIAQALAPFPPMVGNYYPGLRQPIRDAGDRASADDGQLI